MTTSHACEDGWVCEKHPAKPFPHDDCAGPGMPCGMLEHEGLWLESEPPTRVRELRRLLW